MEINIIYIYIILQLLNVICATMKYVLTVKSTPIIAALINALSYTIGAVITYLIVKQEVYIVIPVTFLSNLLGVPIGKAILNKFEKEKLWVYNATVRCTKIEAEDLRRKLKDGFCIHSTFEEIAENALYSMRFFSYDKDDSRIIKNELYKKNAKYYIVEAH